MSCERAYDRSRLLDHTVEALGSPGLIVNPKMVGRLPCECHDLGYGKKLCHSVGVLGFLSDEQRRTYCKSEVPLPDGVSERVKHFREAAKEALEVIKDIPKGQRLDPWLLEMGKALSKRGITV